MADPALWVVKDKDTTIYLFGTVHVLKPGTEWLDGGVKKAYDASPEVVKALLTDRNARWAKWIGARMQKPGTLFIAVGAGHLAGPNSVQSMLKAYKLKAVRIPS